MLAAEPHMNREKLEKMRVLLAADPNLSDDVETFTAKMANLPHMPAFGYEINHKGTPPTISQSTFRDQSMFSNGSSQSPALQQPRLGSPASFTPGQRMVTGGSPASPQFGNMFETVAGGGTMFDSPAGQDIKPQVTSPDFGANSRALFSSPKHAGEVEAIAAAALASPGLGDSQNNMDMFTDLVNDHDTADEVAEKLNDETTALQSDVPAKVEEQDVVEKDVASAITVPSAQPVIDPALAESM
ncbi:hypothetical protein AMS68_007743 [Peltaster fructicola]|uniref:Uncharacterized protein n=1 Tax=Peltaster fructicola TaxID=286661 RepID=A0A6H0Y5I0_9PEZI|nr:hypothetical protein AMS68_007743 [Peltaster fructicola]